MRDAPNIQRRRRRAGLNGGGGSSMTGAMTSDDEDFEEDEDGPVVVDDLDDAVRARATNNEPLGEDFNPRNRMDDVRTRASGYEKEYRLKLVHRLLMRNIPIDKIAEELDVAVSTVQRDRRELFRRLKEDAARLDINLLVGDSLGFYQEISAMALRVASNNKTPTTQKLQALRTAAAGRNDMHRFLSTAGVYDALKFRKQQDTGKSDIDKLMTMTEQLLSDDEIDLEETGNVEGMGVFEDADAEISIV